MNNKMNKNMKAGYQGKPDAMRALAEKLLNHPGKAKDVYYSASCADKESIRPYKTGGHVKESEERMEVPKQIISHLKRTMREEEGEKYGDIKLLRHLKSNPKDRQITRHLKRDINESTDEQHDNYKLLKKIEGVKMDKEHKKCTSGAKPKKYAAGGIGKVRHDQATMSGKQKGTRKGSNSSVYY